MDNKEVRYLYLDDIIPNRFQPRENFDEKALKELAVSIKEHGVIQPIIVRQIGEKYEIIAGERRYKASTMAGLTKIPAIVTNLDDKESSKVALIENLQRKDLTPIEEARTYQKILELDALTQEELAKTMGKSQSAVSNKLRLLSLTDEVQDALLHEQISERHARSLLNVEDPQKQVELLNKVISTRMTVRELDEEIKGNNSPDISSQSSIDMGGNNNAPLFNNINPTSVDIEQIKSNAEDIVKQEPQVDIDNLLKPQSDINNLNDSFIQNNNNNNLNIESSNIPSQEKLGGNGLLEEMTIPSINKTENIPIISEENKINSNLYQNVEKSENQSFVNNPPSQANNSLFGSIDIQPQKTEINNGNIHSDDIKSTVEKVKDTVQNIKNSGKNVEMEEFDFEDFYQIVIRIDK